MAKPISFDDEAPVPSKEVKDTAMLTPGAREKNQTGTNSTKRHTSGKHKPFGKGGGKGHPD
jgi:hypothetical protein